MVRQGTGRQWDPQGRAHNTKGRSWKTNIKGTKVALAMGMSLLTALLVGVIVLQSRNYYPAETAGVAPDQSVIDVQQETGSWDAIKPVASPLGKPAMESLPGREERFHVLTEDSPYACLAREEFADKLNSPNHDAILIEHLERQIDCLLAEAAQNPSLITPQLNREIERLDFQIDVLRLASMVDQ